MKGGLIYPEYLTYDYPQHILLKFLVLYKELKNCAHGNTAFIYTYMYIYVCIYLYVYTTI